METYEHDIEKLKSTYVSFLHNLPFHGLAVVCADDRNIESILQRISRPCITYGFSEKADVQITEFKSSQNKSEFKINNKSQNKSLSIKLNMPGKHNALNVAAAATVALDEGTSCNVIETALKNFPKLFHVLSKQHLQALLMKNFLLAIYKLPLTFLRFYLYRKYSL